MGAADDRYTIEDSGERRRQFWAMLAGLTVGFAGIYYTVVMPMQAQLATMSSELTSIKGSMVELVGARDQMQDSASLLTALREQHEQIEQVRASLTSLRQFRRDVEAEAGRAARSHRTIDQIVTIQNRLQSLARTVDTARQAVDGMAALQDRLIFEQVSTDGARSALERLAGIKQLAIAEASDADLADSGLRQLADLKLRLLSETSGTHQARLNLAQLISIKNTINEESADLLEARAAAEGFISLKDDVLMRGSNVSAARDFAGQLLSLSDQLGDAKSQKVAARPRVKPGRARRSTITLTDLGGYVQTGWTLIRRQAADIAAYAEQFERSHRETSPATKVATQSAVELWTSTREQAVRWYRTRPSHERTWIRTAWQTSSVGATSRAVEPLLQSSRLGLASPRLIREARGGGGKYDADRTRESRQPQRGRVFDPFSQDAYEGFVPQPIDID